MQEKDKILIHEWVYKSLEGEIADRECSSLTALLASDPEAISYYQTCIQINRGLAKIKPILRDSLSMDLCLEEMAAYENQAEIIEIQRAKRQPEKIHVQKDLTPHHSHKTSKVSLYVAILSTAALLFLLLYVYINPKPISQEVAVLSDSINASWVDPADAIKKGERLMTGQGSSTLKEGVINLVYDDGVQVVIEGPAEYELLTATEIALRYGHLFAVVSEAGKGFTISTQNSRIIDLGTEFGVHAGTRGDTQLHVFKGMTTLIAGLRNTEKELVEVHAGQARQIDTYNADIRAIQLDKNTFARSIDSQTHSVWRGETTIDLADTLKGKLTAIHPASGVLSPDVPGLPANTSVVDQDPPAEMLNAPGFFLPIAGNPYVNGIFMSNGADGSIALTSDGSVRWNAPAAPVRQKIGLVRFDISSITGDRTGASLTLYVRGLIGPGKPVAVYGLTDQSADTWSEAKLHYSNAPGFRPAPLGRYDLDAAVWQKLGVISFSQEGASVSSARDLNLDDFIARDTNNLVTLALIAENSDPSAEWRFTTKEGDPSEAPSLVFPSGDLPDVIITSVTGDGADTYLSNDNQYNTVNSADPHGRETSLRVRNYWKDAIAITTAPEFKYNDDQDQAKTCAFRLENRPVGTDTSPVIAMKAGAGITFDLGQLQSRIPENRPAAVFTAVCGMPEDIMDDAAALNNGYTPSVNIYVLVDGQEKFTAADVNPYAKPTPIRIALTPSDRYLTLAVTGAADQKSPFDWCLFVRPQIVFE